MFLGHHERSLDAKGRLVLPAEYRNELPDSAVLAQGQGCLTLQRAEHFDGMVERLRERVRSGEVSQLVPETLMANAANVKIDSAGRINIPDRLADFAGFEESLVVAGQGDLLNIWDARRYFSRRPSGDEALAEAFNQGLHM